MGQKKVKGDIENIFQIISGEKSLREKEEKLKNAKKDAIKNEKDKRRKEIVEGDVKLEQEKVQKRKVVQNIKIFEWKAPERYQFKFNNKQFLVVVVISLLFTLLLAVLGHYLLMGAMLSLLFLIYVLGTTKPRIVKHEIKARGIDTFGKLYEWYMLDSFYFTKKEDTWFLLVETKLNVPRVLIFLLKKKDKDPLFVLLQDKLLYKEIKKWGRIDKMTYGEYIPLEKV